ncbi:MAG: ATP-binding cassette domain-containing protein, partial [Phycisphaerae bacterium]|nr:ATP-binding cassette domain-containing protein [Phycisphaerae bacterium]
MIRFTRVRKEYARTGVALADVSFSVAKGEFAFLTGPSGAGKSTILKLIFAEEFPTSGEVKVGNISSATLKGGKVA